MTKAKFRSPYQDIEGRPTMYYQDTVVDILGPVEAAQGAHEEEVEIAKNQRRVRFPDGWEATAWLEELHEFAEPARGLPAATRTAPSDTPGDYYRRKDERADAARKLLEDASLSDDERAVLERLLAKNREVGD